MLEYIKLFEVVELANKHKITYFGWMIDEYINSYQSYRKQLNNDDKVHSLVMERLEKICNDEIELD